LTRISAPIRGVRSFALRARAAQMQPTCRPVDAALFARVAQRPLRPSCRHPFGSIKNLSPNSPARGRPQDRAGRALALACSFVASALCSAGLELLEGLTTFGVIRAAVTGEGLLGACRGAADLLRRNALDTVRGEQQGARRHAPLHSYSTDAAGCACVPAVGLRSHSHHSNRRRLPSCLPPPFAHTRSVSGSCRSACCTPPGSSWPAHGQC
jgi:hypothetical protein